MSMFSSSTIRNFQPRPQIDANNGRDSLRHPVLDDNAYISITLVVLIPIIFTIILCVTVACLYRYRKKRRPESLRSIDRGTMFHRSHVNPFIIEELPPSYDLISETKKDLSPINNEVIPTTLPPPYNSIPSRSLSEN